MSNSVKQAYSGTMYFTAAAAVILAAVFTYLFTRWKNTASKNKNQTAIPKSTPVTGCEKTDEKDENKDIGTQGKHDPNVKESENGPGIEEVGKNDAPPVMRCPFSGLAMPGIGDFHGGLHGGLHNADNFESKALRDPVKYMEHIQGEVKRVRTKAAERSIEKEMTEDQREQERRTQQEQMEAIFKLMREQEEVFGVNSMDDMQKQMKLYK